MAAAPRVAVMVLNYNGLRWLPNCLASIIDTEYPNMDIYLVDNGSIDGSLEYAKKAFPKVKIISHETNLGFSEGYNRAVQKVEADYLLFLNTDTEVLNRRWVKCLVERVESDPRIAAVAAKLVSMDDPSRLDSVGGMGIPFWRGFVDIGRGEHDRGQYDTAFAPFSFCGAAALVRKDIFMKTEGFDNKFFLFNEDPELSWRLRLLGYRVEYEPAAKVAHYFSGTFGSKTVNALVLYYSLRHLLRAIIKNCGSSLCWALRIFTIFTIIAFCGFLIFDRRKAIAIVRALLWNLSNLKGTYSLQQKVQKSRIASEAAILSSMYQKLPRYEPAEHVSPRRIFNILFEHSQYKQLHRELQKSQE